MFFKKKPKAVAPPTTDDGRAQYRKRNSKAQPLAATLKVTGWEPLQVELIDLSVRGAALRIPFAKDRNLKIDDAVELVVAGMMRQEVITPARVVNVAPSGESHVRYGLEFLNLGNLYAQLDAFYARHFNRRKHLRVMPALDRKIHTQLRWNGGELRAQIYDLSETGLGVVLSKDSAARTADMPGFEFEFKLPGCDETVRGRVAARHRTPLNQNILLGLKFDLEASPQIKERLSAIRAFVEQRAAEMAQWEQSWG